jgi:pre-mRNA cleavage complex 2 protein Pcf11
MDADETGIIEEYGSSLEDLTFNSKPLINVLTMLAEENSKYASSVTKLIEERIYKVRLGLVDLTCTLLSLRNTLIL